MMVRGGIIVHEMYNGESDRISFFILNDQTMSRDRLSLYMRCSTDESRCYRYTHEMLKDERDVIVIHEMDQPGMSRDAIVVEVLQKSFEELKKAKARDKELFEEAKEENRKQYEEKLKFHVLTMKEEMVKEANAKIAEMFAQDNTSKTTSLSPPFLPISLASPTDSEYLRSGMRYMIHNKELKSMFEKQAGVEWFDLIQTFHACKQDKGKPCWFNLEWPHYNKHNMGKTVGELHAMLIEYEKGLPKKAETPQVMMIKGGKIQKSNKKSLKAKGKGKANGKGKDKQVYIPKPKNPKPSAKEHPAKDDTCHHCKEVGQCKRNCPAYLAELIKKKKQVGTASSSDVFIIELFSFPTKSWVYDTSCGTLICNTKPNNNSWVYDTGCGNGVRAQVEAIGSFDLVLPNGLVICLDNCHYAPTITRGVVSVSHLVNNGFVQCFTDYGILVSKNGVLYFNDVPRNGIYEIDMHDLVPNVNSIYNLTPPYTPQHNGVSERRNRNLLDMVRSMMNLTTLPLSFWDYALESATRILNMVPTKKVDKTPYELVHQEAGIKDLMRKSKGLDFLKNLDEPCVYQKASGSNVTFLLLFVDDISHGNQHPSFTKCKGLSWEMFRPMKVLEKQHLFLESKFIGDRSKAINWTLFKCLHSKILKRYKMDNSKRGHYPHDRRLDLNKITKVLKHRKELVNCMKNVLMLRHYVDSSLIEMDTKSQTGYVFVLNRAQWIGRVPSKVHCMSDTASE
ncbi:retrotransposon protein, putative, ty1-copia subclass [Tanacetum coccineum]